MFKYRIHWKSKETGKEGHGEPIFNSFEMAEHTAKQMNENTKYLIHWVQAVNVNPEKQEANKQ